MPNKCEQTRAWPDCTVAVLNDGLSVIVVDDRCYAVRNWNGIEWAWSPWIFREALAALRLLPDNPEDAKTNAYELARLRLARHEA